MLDVDGHIIECEACDVGFRTVEIIRGQLCVNGQPVLIRGVNKHEHDPRTGHYESLESVAEDLRLMKQNNFNAVRCSHYPHQTGFYRLCDRLGLYVVDEANIETHGATPMGRLADHPAWAGAFLERMVRMVSRDLITPALFCGRWATSLVMGQPMTLCIIGLVRSIPVGRTVRRRRLKYAGHGRNLSYVCADPRGSRPRRRSWA